jgi:hypothetical protein
MAGQRQRLIEAPMPHHQPVASPLPRNSSSATPAFGSPALIAGKMHVEYARHAVWRKFDLVLNISRMDPSVA